MGYQWDVFQELASRLGTQTLGADCDGRWLQGNMRAGGGMLANRKVYIERRGRSSHLFRGRGGGEA